MESGPRWHHLQRPLSDYLVGLWSYGHYARSHAFERVLPTGTMNLVVTVDAGGAASAVVSGPRSRCFLLDTSRSFSVIAASFQPGGGFPFFGRPADDVQNLSVPLDALVGHDARRLCDRILEARSAGARFGTLERFLLARLEHHSGRNAAVRYALRAFHASSRAPRVASIVDEIGWSASRFIRTFRHEVGLPPKLYARVARFRRVVDSLDVSQDVDWADVAIACGYFDQPHFVHDFKEFAGVTPSEYLLERVSANHVRVR